jgi:hypothetical protein
MFEREIVSERFPKKNVAAQRKLATVMYIRLKDKSNILQNKTSMAWHKK